MIYFTSDEHYFNENIIRYCNRPFANAAEMNAGLINKINLTPLKLINIVPASQTINRPHANTEELFSLPK
jgi:hypothetical protein